MAISNEIRDLEKQKFEEVENKPAIRVSVVAGGSSPSIYAKKVDDNGSVIYVGEAAVGSSGSSSVWRIQKITLTGSDLDIQWSDGNTDFTKSWDNRATYTYL
jgi:hypothetical protein